MLQLKYIVLLFVLLALVNGSQKVYTSVSKALIKLAVFLLKIGDKNKNAYQLFNTC